MTKHDKPDKDWANIHEHATNAARLMGLRELDVEDAAQYVCERLWIDGDWGEWSNSTVIHHKLTDYVRYLAGRDGHKDVIRSKTFSIDVSYDEHRYEFEIPVEDSLPFLRHIPQVLYHSNARCSKASTDKTNFIIAGVAMGISQRSLANFLDITESAVCHRLRFARKYISKEDLLP